MSRQYFVLSGKMLTFAPPGFGTQNCFPWTEEKGTNHHDLDPKLTWICEGYSISTRPYSQNVQLENF